MSGTRPDLPDDLAAIAASGRDVRIPVQSPNPVTEEDVERLYALADECAVAGDVEGWYVAVTEDTGALRRVFAALHAAGFVTPFDPLLAPTTTNVGTPVRS